MAPVPAASARGPAESTALAGRALVAAVAHRRGNGLAVASVARRRVAVAQPIAAFAGFTTGRNALWLDVEEDAETTARPAVKGIAATFATAKDAEEVASTVP